MTLRPYPSDRRTDPSLSDLLKAGWVHIGNSGFAVYASGTTFTCTGDYTTYFTRGRVLRLYHATTAAYKIVRVVSSAYVNPTTTVTVDGDTLLNETYSSIWADLSPTAAAMELPGTSSVLVAGDLLYAKANTMLARLAIGSAGQRLSVSSGLPAWSNDDGWREANETWTYSSVDDPTGIITVPSDATTKYTVGMRIRFVNGGNTIHGIITVVAATSLTFLHEIDPSDSLALTLMANSAITSPYFSAHDTPFGFPKDKRKWSVEKTDTSTRTQNAPATGTWYNLGTTNSQLTIPIGAWDVSYQVVSEVDSTSTTAQDIAVTLSTANNNEADKGFTSYMKTQAAGNGANAMSISAYLSRNKVLVLASKTTYYLNASAVNYNATNLNFYGGTGTTVIRAVSAYL